MSKEVAGRAKEPHGAFSRTPPVRLRRAFALLTPILEVRLDSYRHRAGGVSVSPVYDSTPALVIQKRNVL